MKKKNEASEQAGNTTNSKAIIAKSPVNLKPSQAKAMSVFYKFPDEFISTFKFRDNGVMHPSSRTNELEAKGAIIHTTFKPVVDSLGEIHERVAHYLFEGWEV